MGGTGAGGAAGETWPLADGEPMLALVQLNLTEAPVLPQWVEPSLSSIFSWASLSLKSALKLGGFPVEIQDEVD